MNTRIDCNVMAQWIKNPTAGGSGHCGGMWSIPCPVHWVKGSSGIGRSCSSDLILGPGTSRYSGCGHPKKGNIYMCAYIYICTHIYIMNEETSYNI